MIDDKEIPRKIYQEFYSAADEKMESMLALGLLTNRFTLRGYGTEMMRRGYVTGQAQPDRETARAIWDAAQREIREGQGVHPDFETFYNILIS